MAGSIGNAGTGAGSAGAGRRSSAPRCWPAGHPAEYRGSGRLRRHLDGMRLDLRPGFLGRRCWGIDCDGLDRRRGVGRRAAEVRRPGPVRLLPARPAVRGRPAGRRRCVGRGRFGCCQLDRRCGVGRRRWWRCVGRGRFGCCQLDRRCGVGRRGRWRCVGRGRFGCCQLDRRCGVGRRGRWRCVGRRPVRLLPARPAVRGRPAEVVEVRRPGPVECCRFRRWWRLNRCGRVGDNVARRRGRESMAADRPGAAALGWPAPARRRRSAVPGWPGSRIEANSPPPWAAQVPCENCSPPWYPLPVLMPQLPPDSHPATRSHSLSVSRGRVARQCDATATDHSPGESEFGDADVGSGGLTMPSAHTPKTSSRDAPTRSAVGFGRKRSPGHAESRRKRRSASPQGAAYGSGPISADRWVPRLHPRVGVCPPIGWSSAL